MFFKIKTSLTLFSITLVSQHDFSIALLIFSEEDSLSWQQLSTSVFSRQTEQLRKKELPAILQKWIERENPDVEIKKMRRKLYMNIFFIIIENKALIFRKNQYICHIHFVNLLIKL
jgi:hypothetical protein